ncbi:rhomboid family intramembrane serine protease [Aerobium aerolatum]|uniref:Membrane associated serine protease, rhomboid family n=1 Tax=Aquamicrobium aerolatum DSM 21857 TaxID=1121003 RepID=A0A1I3QB95_9HYPH|nr:rhomboid family intramembrane serine protease [Aquamicrobium aerolatum]SFJ30869.1 Membrane associated serine protease, rhomboid family [Aquamicrobium aerolatum DSM 21857]
MFIPLHDANALKHIRAPYVTYSIIAINCLIYLFAKVATEDFVTAATIGLGYIPVTIFEDVIRPPTMDIVPGYATYVTYAFLHADFWHLAGNMLFLWVFGDNVEDALGHFRFAIFYLACAVVGAFAHGLIVPDSHAPLIGASGAVAGIVAAYLILHPRVKVWVLALGRVPLRLPAWILLALWVLFQFAMLAIMGEDEVSWAAHVGGILAGAILVVLLRRRGVPIFNREIVRPPAAQAATPAEQPSRWGRN